MASVFIDGYEVYYSIVDGRIHHFHKKNEQGKWEPVTENYEEELIKMANAIIKRQSKDGHGFSAFLHKLAKEGKVKLPDEP